MKKLQAICRFIIILLVGMGVQSPWAASGMFPKMPAATNVYIIDGLGDSENGRMTLLALQGLINQSSAEVYVVTSGQHKEQLDKSGKPQIKLHPLEGPDGGLKTLFNKYQGRVKKMILYDPQKDWTPYLALMAAAKQNAIPVTESIKNELVSQFGWKGEIEDFRNRWKNRVEAYDWALLNLMPGCTKKVVFALQHDKRLVDYVVASKGFIFWLDFANPIERSEVEKIFQTRGYSVGTSLMGYASGGDDANKIANKYGIGCIVSDYYGNGSFWSSFPNKRYSQLPGRPVPAKPGKVYVTITWSDGDNIQFDQNATYFMWKDPARGTVPVGTTLSPALQELNPPLLDSYYAQMTRNDELVAGPSGVQFIYGDDFNTSLFPTWCNMNKAWIAGAGFRTACFWHTTYPSRNYTTFLNTCGLTGILHAGNSIGVRYDARLPVMDEGHGAWKEEDIFDLLSKVHRDETKPVFMGFKCIVQAFGKDGGKGYTKIKRQVDRLEKAYPGRYVFLLPKDLFATIRSYYHLPQVP